ncbi:hypothetical protein OG205_16550 [Lentzea sp. NBC_00516]|uniref:GH12 family glycosyl hydrolase domain-containing protein n=1 Tax=Lentzea sp. NBC_00516 TaxID=2903582 RepID=UPI002E81E24F|nr:hypothetical protein [Lentzea sp. NBC_00516]WUD28545.1 hypothetical protein OG205_16550 [Lentzea sp. NBC_00516]
MTKIIRALTVALVAALTVSAGAGIAMAAAWDSTNRWGTWSNGGYTVRNNVWGNGSGPQSIWANSYSNWGVNSNQPNTGGVKSYPHAEKRINRKLSSIGSLTSNFNVSYPNSGSYTTAYDIWANNNAYEIMLWVNKVGNVGPIGSRQATVSVGGHSWDVYRGSNGSNQVFSFVRKGNTGAGSVDIKAVMNWIRSKGWFGDVTIGAVQFGYEITSSRGGLNFRTNSFSVSSR